MNISLCLNALFMLLLFTGFALPGRADHLTGGAVGLNSPTNVITFDEVNLLDGQAVTNQFAPFGALFENFGWNAQPQFGLAGSIGFSGADLVNGFSPFPTMEPMVISFTIPVTAAAFAAVEHGITFHLSAFLGGVSGTLIDSFDIVIPKNPGAGFIGFANETFDAIQITPLTPAALAIDTVEMQAAVPEPTSFALLGSLMALIGMNFAVFISRSR